jgi:predicted ATPase
MDFTLHLRNLRGLRSVDWTPRGLSVVVGANGSGKTTLLLALRMLRAAFDGGLGIPGAVSSFLGGSSGLKNWDAGDDEPIEFGLDLGDLSWRATLTGKGRSVDEVPSECLRRGDQTVFHRVVTDTFHFKVGDRELPLDGRLGLRAIADAGLPVEGVEDMRRLFRSFTVFTDPDLRSLRDRGSSTADDRHLHSRGTNTFTMLRRWYTRRDERLRYEFVLAGLRAAFPETCADLDFAEAGPTVTVNVYSPRGEHRSPIGTEANGLLSMMVNLAAVAGAPDGGLIAIDEPENALHPFAIRRFMEMSERWTSEHDQTLILTTHSPVVLDHLAGDPGRVFVLQPGAARSLAPLTDLKNPDWLRDFRLGDLYVDGDFGANAPAGA